MDSCREYLEVYKSVEFGAKLRKRRKIDFEKLSGIRVCRGLEGQYGLKLRVGFQAFIYDF